MPTPAVFASPTVSSMIRGSPAWNPHAIFAEVTTDISASAPAMRWTPNDSPMSQFKSTERITAWTSSTISNILLRAAPAIQRHELEPYSVSGTWQSRQSYLYDISVLEKSGWHIGDSYTLRSAHADQISWLQGYK